MKRVILIGVTLTALWSARLSHAEAGNATALKGRCTPESHVAEGAAGEDLTKHRSPFFCDTAAINFPTGNPKNVVIEFVGSKPERASQVSFAGTLESKDVADVRTVYFQVDRPHPVAMGVCKFFYEKQDVSNIACGAKLVEAGRQTVLIVSFEADTISKQAQPKTVQYPALALDNKSGVVSCSVRGTTIDFALNGRGTAQVIRIKNSRSPFRRAAQQTRTWEASFLEQDSKPLLVLEDGHKTRIMVNLSDGKGAALSARGITSDISCRTAGSP